MSQDPFSPGPCPARPVLFVGIALMSLLMSACPFPVSKHPLSQPGEHQNDERLAGVWYQETVDGSVYIHVAKTNTGRMDGVLVEHKVNGLRGLGMDVCRGLTTRLDQQRFLNISQCANIWSTESEFGLKKQSNEEAPYLIVLYEINDAGELTYKGISAEYVIESIQAGRLEGSTNDGVKITASTPDLIQFIEKSDPDRLYFKTKEEGKRSFTFRKMVVPPASN